MKCICNILIKENPNTHKSLCSKSHTLKKGGDNQMGRKKDDVILLRCYKKEKEELRKKSKQANMTMSEYIIALSENKKIFIVDGVLELSLEIRRIGNNINQIAMVANSQKFVNEYQLERVINEMEKVNRKINLIWDKLK